MTRGGRQRRVGLRVLSVLLSVLLSAVVAWLLWPRPPLGEPAQVTVRAGSSWSALSVELSRQGWLLHPWELRVAQTVFTPNTVLRPGTYSVSASASLWTVVRRLTQAPDPHPPLVVIEGIRFRDLRALIAARPDVDHRFAQATDEALMAALGAPGQHPEGRFAPDTWDIEPGATDLSIYQRLYKAQQDRLAAAWARRAPDLPYATPDEALIMASIIEKETGLAAERRRVAGVFVRRLQKGMRLQTDPTVIYGVGDRYDGVIRRSHLRDDNPYNTYRIVGLPPTPIALPGTAALAAALDPAPGDELFFVANDRGEHIFSSTYEAHRRAVERYQRP